MAVILDHSKGLTFEMKKTELYQHLIEIAVKFGITVSEQNFRATNVNAVSGLCVIRDELVFVMDKHLPVADKVELLAACLRTMPLDDIYIIPAIRDYLNRIKFPGK